MVLYLGIIAQNQMLTVAESSDYSATAKYADVMGFVSQLDEKSDLVMVDTIATSAEGRAVPMLILANPMIKTLEDLDEDRRMVVYFQANIHAGEVEGKEASLMLARDIVNGKFPLILDRVVLLIVPNLNPDGNEKISTENRTRQNGPEQGVGLRRNGQWLDLNRDGMKMESPEIQGVVTKILNAWDPAITVDCHTTNGSYHEEPITFTWMMNPNGDRNLINFMRDEMMPSVKTKLFETYKVENVFYGEFIDRLNIDKGWISYAAEPRYLVNYIGLRNRLAILNENYVYADYRTRVQGCYHLLLTILEYASENKNKIEKLLATTDYQAVNRFSEPSKVDSFALEYKGIPTPEPITIKAIEADTIPGVKGYWRYKQSDRKRTVTIPYIADYFPTENIAMPYAYIIEPYCLEVIEKLREHGIVVEKIAEERNVTVEIFEIEELKPNTRMNQGHYTNKLKGRYKLESITIPGEAFVVRTDQPLGKLAAYLLEPKSDDSLLKWNFFDRYLVPQWGRGYYPYPVYRMEGKVKLPVE